jgi:glycosyltransferase involved in cell wall biosynthesis
MRNLNIAFLLDNGPRSYTSLEDFHYRLCRALVARGATPVLVYSGSMPGDVYSRLRSSGAEVIAEARLHGMRRYYQLLASTFTQFNTNLVHVGYFVYYSIIPWLVRSQSVRRIVYTEGNGWLPKKRHNWSWKRVLNRLRTKLICCPIERYIAVSQFVSDRLQLYGVDPARITVVHNGIDVERFSPDANDREVWRKQYGLGADETAILTVGRLDPIKGVATVVHACGELMKRGTPFRLFIAGKGPLESELKTLSAQLGMADRTVFLGHVQNPLSLFRAGDVFTLASQGEAFGLVLAEAMACGLPCVGSRCGGIPEVIDEGHTGLLATPGDPHSFADAYERILQDHPLRTAMGKEGVVRARSRFNIDKAVQDTIAVYEEVAR